MPNHNTECDNALSRATAIVLVVPLLIGIVLAFFTPFHTIGYIFLGVEGVVLLTTVAVVAWTRWRLRHPRQYEQVFPANKEMKSQIPDSNWII